jgi:uncharacterized protein (TIGR02391 family)
MAGFLAGYRQMGTQIVVIIQNESTQDEKRFEAECFVQADKGTFELETPIYEGDIVEMDDPRGGRQRRFAREVKQYTRMPQRTRVTWGSAAPARTAPVRRLHLENLHVDVISAASNLFADGHYAAAVSEAFKSIEVRVRTLTNITDKSGSKLVGQALGTSTPPLDVSTETGQSAEDEQEGYQQLFRGAMLGVRNPKAHELFKPDDPQQALEYLGFASLLHRRLDIAEAKLTP